jgi:hypothetical protein
MVDELTKLDIPLFRTQPLKKVREVSKRPEERRTTRDTYSESDELALLSEAERLEKDRKKRRERQLAEGKDNKKTNEQGKDLEEEGEAGAKKKHVNIIV